MICIIKLNNIYNEDCIRTMSRMEDNSVELIIADPPYYKIVKNDWDNQWESEAEYYEWFKLLIKEFKRIIKPNGSVYIWNWFDNICSIGHFAKEEGFIVRNLITWNRGAGREKNNWGSQKEDLLYLTCTNNPVFNLNEILLSLDNPNRKMKKSSWDRLKYARKDRKNFADNKVNPSNVWFDSIITYNSPEKVNHPTQKPLSICSRIVKASSNTNDLVYIPFAGSGSEIISCIQNNRNYIASEISGEYIEDIINTRISEIHNVMPTSLQNQ